MVTQVRFVPWRTVFFIVVATFFVPHFCAGQSQKSGSQRAAQQSAFGDQISGMYSFVREGEFVQITVEEGKLSGFVSRYGERESDKDAFLDQFISKGSIDGHKIAFTTKPVHGTWFEFAGEVSRGSAKSPAEEGYWIIRGTLKEYDEDEAKHVTSKSREITFKSFPQDVEGDQPK
jgi:hypothetical protein